MNATRPQPRSRPKSMDDMIAAAYLEGRDIYCSGCGQNRRDGATIACPNCRTPIKINALRQRPGLLMPAGLAVLAMAVLVFVALFDAVVRTLWIVDYHQMYYEGMETREYWTWMILGGLAVATALLCALFGVIAMFQAMGRSRHAGAFIVTAVLLFAFIAVPETVRSGYQILTYMLERVG